MHGMIHATLLHMYFVYGYCILFHSCAENQQNSRSQPTRRISSNTNIPKPSCQLRPGRDNEIALWTCRSKSCTKRYPAERLKLQKGKKSETNEPT